MIMELMNNGINVFGAKKGAGSVNAGISYLQGKKIHITKNSLNTIKEFRELQNDTNSRGDFTGKYLGDDHSVDATRYSIHERSASSGAVSSFAGQRQNQTYHERYRE